MMAEAHGEEDEDHAMVVAEVHMAIRSRSYRQLVDDYLSKAPNPQHLLWQTNQLGWMAIHVAASCHDLPMEWWEYLLLLAGNCCSCSRCSCFSSIWPSQQRRGLVNCRTSLGFSTIDLFFRTWLDPFPWQRHHLPSAQRLGQAMSEIGSSSDQLQNFIECLQQLRQLRWESVKNRKAIAQEVETSDGYTFEDLTVDPIMDVAQFWYRMEILLLRAACADDVIPFGFTTGSQSYTLLCTLAHTGCPKVVAQLALRMVQEELLTQKNEFQSFDPGLLPIHIWAKSMEHGPDQWGTDDGDGVLEALLEFWPESASMAWQDGQLPLHKALAQGKSWKRLGLLFRANPDALWTVDKSTALSSFCLAALPVHQKREKTSLCARQAVGSKIGGMWHFLPPSTRQQALASAQQEVDAEQLTTIYQVLRAFPNAVAPTNENVPAPFLELNFNTFNENMYHCA